MRKIRKILLGLAAGVLVFMGGGAVYADETTSTLNVSPMNQRIILTPGESYRGTIKVSNPNSAKSNLEYSAIVGSFSQVKDEDGGDDYGSVDTDTVTSYNQMMNWITLDKDNGSVEPNTTDILGFTINVPADAPAGGQYATIVFTDETDHSTEGGNVNIMSIPRVASIIYAEVAGETREEGAITSNSMPSFLLNNTLEATSLVRNNGNVHTDATYVLQVWPLFSDEEICTNEENPSISLIMPETERYHTESCSLPSVGVFRAKQTVTIFGETSIVEKTIIVCPLWLLFLIIFAIIILIMWLIFRAKTRKKASHKN